MGRILLGVGLVLAAASISDAAQAGAWLAPEEGQQLSTNGVGARNEAWMLESGVYWEAPLAEDFSYVIAPWFEEASDLENSWRGEAVIGVKHVVFRDETYVMALQAGGFWRSDPPLDCGEGGIEARWLGGRTLGQSGFLNLETAARVLDGDCRGGRIDLTAGWRANEYWLALGQFFFDDPDEGEESLKAQFSLVRFDSSGQGVQLGVRARLDGDDAEPMVVLGFWDDAEEDD